MTIFFDQFQPRFENVWGNVVLWHYLKMGWLKDFEFMVFILGGAPSIRFIMNRGWSSTCRKKVIQPHRAYQFVKKHFGILLINKPTHDYLEG